MNFLNFLESLKNSETTTFLESVIIPAYKTLCEDQNLLPDSPEQTDALIEKKVKDVASLEKLKQTQDELARNKEELQSKAPDLVENSSIS